MKIIFEALDNVSTNGYECCGYDKEAQCGEGNGCEDTSSN
jgi:hypothetical protein